MPLGIPPPSLPGAMPPPPPATGATGSAPLNIGMGAASAVGTAALTTTQLGVDVTEVSYGINLLFQQIKTISWFDQHRWWPIVLILLGIGAFLVITQGDIIQATLKGFAAAFQAALTYHSFRVAGVNVMPPAPDLPGQ